MSVPEVSKLETEICLPIKTCFSMHYQIEKHFANICYILGPWMNWFGGHKHKM